MVQKAATELKGEGDDEDILDVVVEGEEDPQQASPTSQSRKDDSGDDDDDGDQDGGPQSKESGEDDDDGDDGDDGDDSDDDESQSSEAIREKRRQHRQARKRRAREREDSLRRELSARDQVISDLTNRLNTIERRGTSTDLAQVDNSLQQLTQIYSTTQAQLKEAVDNQDGATVVSAMENLQKIQRRAQELGQIRQALQQRTQTPQPLDPRLVSNARSWTAEHRWYQPDGRDRDSRTVRRLDDELVAEGWNPTTSEYWQELTERVKKELPHRYEKDYNNNRKGANGDPQRKRKQIVAGSGTNNARGSEAGGSQGGRRQVTISKERREALQQAGLWDDPKLRSQAIREMQLFDQQNNS